MLLAARQRVQQKGVRQADGGDAGPNIESNSGAEGPQESRATSPDAGCAGGAVSRGSCGGILCRAVVMREGFLVLVLQGERAAAVRVPAAVPKQESNLLVVLRGSS